MVRVLRSCKRRILSFALDLCLFHVEILSPPSQPINYAYNERPSSNTTLSKITKSIHCSDKTEDMCKSSSLSVPPGGKILERNMWKNEIKEIWSGICRTREKIILETVIWSYMMLKLQYVEMMACVHLFIRYVVHRHLAILHHIHQGEKNGGGVKEGVNVLCTERGCSATFNPMTRGMERGRKVTTSDLVISHQ